MFHSIYLRCHEIILDCLTRDCDLFELFDGSQLEKAQQQLSQVAPDWCCCCACLFFALPLAAIQSVEESFEQLGSSFEIRIAV